MFNFSPAPFRPFEVSYPQDDIRKLSGTIKDANLIAQSGVTVYVYQRSTSSIAGTAVTAVDGTWTLSVNNDPAGFDAVWYQNGVPLIAGIMVAPLFAS
jgi:hypothetical protein